MSFRDFDIALFLRDYWQKQPLLIRQAWPEWVNPLEPDELAGLACEDQIESRLIVQTDRSWSLEHGPFAESRFAQLGAQPWTLLVQAVDHHVPDVADLITPFRFVPNWRIDDVMVSYASDQGGVGPHSDQYDVFLVQGLGRRRWQLGALCDADTPLLPHADLRLLADFTPTQEWVLEPGDILYVPPGMAHNGVALGDDCMTYSIGFRTPSRHDLLMGWCDHLAEAMPDEDRYADPDLQQQSNPGEISATAIAQMHAMVTEALADRAAFARWFGEHSSAPKYPDIDWQPDAPLTEEQVRNVLGNSPLLTRNPASRFSFIRQGTDAVHLFVDGASYDCGAETRAFAEQLCAQDQWVSEADSAPPKALIALITALFNQGSITLAAED
ncbi:MAG: hypothetical protein RLZZ136_1325 [Pseudomonadota bacterium]|jgi:50S ribosomal protein L16 3-hydroxylase